MGHRPRPVSLFFNTMPKQAPDRLVTAVCITLAVTFLTLLILAIQML